MRRTEEERAKKEDEEAQKWMGMISVEKGGTGVRGIVEKKRNRDYCFPGGG